MIKGFGSKKLKVIPVLLTVALSLVAGLMPASAGETKDAGVVKVEIHHLLLDLQGEVLQVREVLRFNNSSQDVFVGTGSEGAAKKAVLNIDLPEGYSNLQVQELRKSAGNPQAVPLTLGPDAWIATGDGIAITKPLQPGQTEFSFSYNMIAPGGQASLKEKVNYPTGTVYILGPAEQLTLSSGVLQDVGVQAMNQQQFYVLAGQGLNPGSELSFKVVKGASPQAKAGGGAVDRSYSGDKVGFHSASHLARWGNSPLRNTNPHVWLVFLVILAAGVAVAITLLVRQKHKEQEATEDAEKLEKVFLNLAAKHKRLLNKIRELDEQHEAGEIPPETYEEMRDRYKEMLVDVKIKLKRLEEMEERED